MLDQRRSYLQFHNQHLQASLLTIATEYSTLTPRRARYLSVTEAPTILTFTRGWGRNIFVFFKPPGGGGESAPSESVNVRPVYDAGPTLGQCLIFAGLGYNILK